MSKIISMHFTVDGDGLTNIVQQVYCYEDRERARNMIDSIKTLTDEQKLMILEGEAALTGISVCSKPECHQCKDVRGKKEMKYVKIINQDYVKELYKRNIVTKRTAHKYMQIIIHSDKVKHNFKVKRALLDNYCNVIERNEDKIKLINARDIDPYKKVEYVTQVDHNKADAHTRLVQDIGLESKYDQFGEKLDDAFLKYYVLYHTSDYSDGFKRIDNIEMFGGKRDKTIVTGIDKKNKKKIEVSNRE